MNERGVILTVREQKRLRVITELDAGRVSAQEAADVLGLSSRQVWRLVAAFRKEGAAGLAHGNRGREPVNKTPRRICEQVQALARKQYADYNDSHMTEELEKEHQIVISRSTARRLRRAMGQPSPRQRRAPRGRRRRERYGQPGLLLQLDGSQHHWLEERGPALTLLIAIDDASSEIPAGLFREEEDDAGYFELMWCISQSHGLPQAVYTDRHTIFHSPKPPTLEQELAGTPPCTQFGRLMDELAIEMIPAYSPQAKGRVERLFGTLQDRLVKALRQANARTQAEANQVLRRFLPEFNARFSVAPAEPGSAYHPWPSSSQPEDPFCLKHQRTVSNDNTISFNGKQLQIPPGPDRISYARARVDVQQRLDGSLAICYHGQTLVIFQPATPGPVRVGQFTPAEPSQPVAPTQVPEPQPVVREPRTPYKPPPDHPWRRYPISANAKRGAERRTQTERQDIPASG